MSIFLRTCTSFFVATAPLTLSLLVSSGITGVLTSNSYAQSRLPGVIDRELLLPRIPEERRISPPADVVDEPLPPVSSTDTRVVANLHYIEFKGATVLSIEKLNSVANNYLNRPLTLSDIAQLKYEVTKLFYDEGFILVKVVTPPQDMKHGHLRVDIYEAEIGEVNVSGEQVHAFVADAFTSRVDEREIFNEATAESIANDFNDLKNIAATVNLRSGAKFKTTDMDVLLTPVDEDVQNISIDNYGSELTGTNVASARFEKSNLLGIGESIQADFKLSNDSLWSVGGGFNAPIGIDNIKLELSALHSENDIGDRLAALDASGETDRLSLGFSKSFLNTKTEKLGVRTGLEVREHKSFLADVDESEDSIRKLFLSGNYFRQLEQSQWYAALRLSQGIDLFDATGEGDLLSSRSLGDNDVLIVEPQLFGSINTSQDGKVNLTATGQMSSDTVLSSDLFVLGGYGSVRGFEPAETTGEHGFQFSVEYQHLVYVDETWQLLVGPFFDGGAVYNDVPGSVSDSHLYAAGLGAEVNMDLSGLGNTNFRVDWANPLGDYESDEVDDNTLYFRVSKDF